jgi:hypothetical protein
MPKRVGVIISMGFNVHKMVYIKLGLVNSVMEYYARYEGTSYFRSTF